MCLSMLKRGGGVKDIRARQLAGLNSRDYVIDLVVNVCDAMGANIINTLCEKLKT
jgi:hydroxymethylglutaryl-CoA reductase